METKRGGTCDRRVDKKKREREEEMKEAVVCLTYAIGLYGRYIIGSDC